MNNDDQIEYWNGQAGEKWVQNSDMLDAMLAPFAAQILESAALKPGERVIDIGCGAGALSLKAAAQVGDRGHVTGVDVSQPMIGRAIDRARAAGAPANFAVHDASAYRPDTPCDALISRFGVMFFEDPGTAFAEMRKNLKPGGRMAFACWQPLAENDWVTIPLQATLPFLTEPPIAPPPRAPGPFAFSDKEYMARFLADAGWTNVAIEGWTCPMSIPGDSLAENAAFMMELGPSARLIAAQKLDPEPIAAALIKQLTELAGTDGQISLKGAVWIVTGTA